MERIGSLRDLNTLCYPLVRASYPNVHWVPSEAPEYSDTCMKIQLSDPDAAAPLVAALTNSDCLATQTGFDTVDVVFPWLESEGDARQARMELVFFLRAWASGRPGLRTTLDEPEAAR